MADAARAISEEISREDALEFLRIAAIVSPTSEDLNMLRKMLEPHAGRLARLGFSYCDLV